MGLDLRGKSILLVDDFREMRLALKGILVSLGGTRVDDARDGVQALECLAAHRYDLVLCDHNLGDGRDGQQVLEEARHRRLLAEQTLFVMVTAENTSEMVMGVVEYFPDGYLVKPVTRPVLELRLVRLLRRKSILLPIEHCLQRRDMAGAVAACDRALAGSGVHRLEVLRLKSRALMAVSRNDEAQELFEQVLAERDLPWAMAGLGRVHLAASRYAEAEDVLSRLTEEHKAYMEGYDRLAECKLATGDTAGAEQVLRVATALSPKAIRRQQKLGWLALRNGNADAAIEAFRMATRLGRHSCYRGPADHAGLSRAYTAAQQHRKSGEAIGEGRRRHRHSASPLTDLDVAEAILLHATGEVDKAGELLAGTAQDYLDGRAVSTDTAIDLLKICLEFGPQKVGMAVGKRLVREYHEDEAVVAAVHDAFEKAGLGVAGNDLLDSARKEIFTINNRGVQLARDGQLSAAVDCLVGAAKELPANGVINLNAAQVLIKLMQQDTVTAEHMLLTRQCLGHAASGHAANPRYQKLLTTLRTLATGAAA